MRALPPSGSEPGSDAPGEELVKRWLLTAIERTPAAELGELPFEWAARETPELVAMVAAELREASSVKVADENGSRNGAGRDPLTGLAGCAALEEWLASMVSAQRRFGSPVAVLGLDVDGLRHINEAHGQETGDAVLAAIGNLLRGEIRAVDRAFRLRDDEFCVLAAGQEAEQARAMARRLLRAAESLEAGREPGVGISVGIASCPRHGEDPRRLLGRATEALYAAKAAGEPLAIAP